MSNDHLLKVALAEHQEEQRRKQRGLMSDTYNLDCSVSVRDIASMMTPLGEEEAKAHRAKYNLPTPPTYTPPADTGQRQRKSDAKVSDPVNKPEYTGGSVSYYRVKVERPTSKELPPYEAECNDIIEALQLNYAEGNALKAIWRMAAARMGKMKKGYTDGLYDAEKVEFFGARLVAQNKAGV